MILPHVAGARYASTPGIVQPRSGDTEAGGVCLIGCVSGYARLYVMEFCESVATAIGFEGDLSSQSWVKKLKIASISHHL